MESFVCSVFWHPVYTRTVSVPDCIHEVVNMKTCGLSGQVTATEVAISRTWISCSFGERMKNRNRERCREKNAKEGERENMTKEWRETVKHTGRKNK